MKHIFAVSCILIIAMGMPGPLDTVQTTAAVTRTFTGAQDAFFNERLNWNPSDNFPQAGDTAVIPDTLTCDIRSTRQEEVAVIDIESGGTLRILGSGSLEISANSTVDGSLLFVDPGAGGQAGDGTLFIAANLTVSGDGGIIEAGNSGNFNTGRILTSTTPAYLLTLDSSGETFDGLVVENVAVFTVELNNQATLLVTESGLTTDLQQQVYGDGHFNVTAGTLEFGDDSFLHATGLLHLEGADAKVVFNDPSHACNSIRLELISGTVDVNKKFCTTGTFEFGGDEDNDLIINLNEGQQSGFRAVPDCTTYQPPYECEE